MSTANFDKLSIVIPVGPDDNAWQHLLKELAVFGKDIQIILSACQAQSSAINLPDNALWIQSEQGRAKQLNAGAKQVTGDLIWFLHADTRFSLAVIDTIQSYIKSGEQSMAYFRLKFAEDGPKQTRLNAWAANIRSRYFGLPFGDQGFIINKSIFEHTNGFDETVSVGEDLDFVVRLKALDIPLKELSAELITSARRYQQHGWLLTSTRHIWLTWVLTRQAKHRLVFNG
ncbi:MAG: glycosyltransferase [Methylomarinum sp.]|nr:glycosyltransferase [Methylomarinum sp.]